MSEADYMDSIQQFSRADDDAKEVLTGSKVDRDLNKQSMAAASLVAELATDDAELLHDMVEGETGLLEAIDAAMDEMDHCDVIVEGCKAKVDQINKRKHRAERRRERLRALIEQAICMADLKTVTRPTATITVKDVPPKPFIDDESLIPTEFWKAQPPKLDRAALTKAAQERDIPGVSKTNGGISLQIRRT